jgi:isopentenyldiphosphate isomerase
MITLYRKKAPNTPILCERKDFYDNRYGKYKDHYAAIIDVFLFNGRGEMLLQKRARNKRNSPGKLHTSVGVHINKDEQASFALIHECIEELGVAALAFPPEQFDQAITKLSPYTDSAAILCEMGDHFLDYPAKIPTQGNIQDRIWFYVGLYDGPIKNNDHSCAGFEWMNLENYAKEVLSNSDQFTYPFRYYMGKFGNEFAEFVKKYCRP